MRHFISTFAIIYLFNLSLSGMEKPRSKPKAWGSIIKNVVRTTKCPCGKTSDDFEGLITHIKTDHYDDKFYRCPSCEKNTPSLNKFLLHFTSHAIDVFFHCSKCNMNCNSQAEIYKHFSFHKLYLPALQYLWERGFKGKNSQGFFICPDECQTKYKLFLSFLKHIDSIHISPQTPLKCNILGTQISTIATQQAQNPSLDYSNEVDFLKFMQRQTTVKSEHQDITTIQSQKLNPTRSSKIKDSVRITQCACGQKADDLEILISHIKKDHLKNKTYKCPSCEKKTTSLNKFLIHCAFHTKENCFHCFECSIDFKSKSNIHLHLSYHKKYPEVFQYLLKMNYKGKNSQGFFICPDECNKKYKQFLLFLKHIDLTHVSPKKPLKHNILQTQFPNQQENTLTGCIYEKKREDKNNENSSECMIFTISGEKTESEQNSFAQYMQSLWEEIDDLEKIDNFDKIAILELTSKDEELNEDITADLDFEDTKRKNSENNKKSEAPSYHIKRRKIDNSLYNDLSNNNHE